MFSEFQKAQEALTLIALARCSLDIAKQLQNPNPWEVKGRTELQNQARALLARVRSIRKEG